MTRMTDRAECLALCVYYALTAVIGVLTIPGDTSPALDGALGPGLPIWIFGGCYALLGALGIVSRLTGRVRAEARVIIVLGLAALVHGLIAIADGGIVTGLRVAIAPLMMAAYARRVVGWHISPRGLADLEQAVEHSQVEPR